MAIFETKKNIKEKTGETKSKKSLITPISDKEGGTLNLLDLSRSSVILRPRITEKSGIASQKLNAYTFEIGSNISKNEVIKAVKALYKITPLKINVINLPRKSKFTRGKKGFSGGLRKAVVYLKKADKIEFI